MDRITTKLGNELTVISRELIFIEKSNRNRAYCTVSCNICNSDKDLFPFPFTVREDLLRAGGTPCACSFSYQYSKNQLELLVKRKHEYVRFLGWKYFDDKIPKNSYPILFCNLHNYVVDSTNCYHFLNKDQFGCKYCKVEKVVEANMLSDEQVTSRLISTGFFDNRHFFKRVSDERCMFSYECPVCSGDEYVEEGLCSGTFKTYLGSLLLGTKSCRCGRGYVWTKQQQEYRIKRVLLENNPKHEFLGILGEYTGAFSRFQYLCGNGHGIQEVSVYQTTNHKSDCKECSYIKTENTFGFYTRRSEELDNLYFLKLTNEKETFLKIGRAFDTKIRYNFYTPIFDIEELIVHKDAHKNIFLKEKEILTKFSNFKYKPLTEFDGSTECFNMGVLEDIRSYVENFNKGKMTEVKERVVNK